MEPTGRERTDPRRERQHAELLRRVEADLGHPLTGEYRNIVSALLYAMMRDPDAVE